MKQMPLLMKILHRTLLLNDSTVQQISTQKHLGIHLDEELTFKHHINEKINKANKDIRIIRKLDNILPRSALARSLAKASSRLW